MVAAFRRGLASLLLRASRYGKLVQRDHGTLPFLRRGGVFPLPPRGTFAAFRSSESVTEEKEDSVSASADNTGEDDLRSRVFQLGTPRRSAAAAIEKWIGEGGTVEQSELRGIVKQLARSRRYKHALEILEWMGKHHEYTLSAGDYGDQIDLITKVHGIDAAERYFEALPPTEITCASYTALLHSYASAKLTEKAEVLFDKMKTSNSTLSILPYNEMMTMYMSNSQYDKISALVEELSDKQISPDLFTYNLWISACAATLDINSIRRILDKMSCDPNFSDGWKMYVRLVNIYITAGRLENTENAIVETDKKITQREWITYDFLIMLYAGLGNGEMISQIWKSLKMISQKMTGRNYVSILSSLIMLGRTKQAAQIIDEWKRSTAPCYDVSLTNRLLDAFAQAGLSGHATFLHRMLLEKDLLPRY
ncbi:Pentatricopeptide repeat-containing protein [Nymphaea thermarum]|nr:Pentatricopeptide repeat-containing protein [Nymphaea thermarum]